MHQLTELPHFTIQVEHPETHEVHQFYARVDEPELTLAHVMNLIAFDREQGVEFDANPNLLQFQSAVVDLPRPPPWKRQGRSSWAT